MLSFSEFLCGRCRITTASENTLALMNILLATHTVYRGLQVGREDGQTVLETSHGAARRLSEICKAQNISVSVRSISGLPHLWASYRMRLGIWIGLIISLALIVAGSGVLWQVRVYGNERLSDDEVRDLLSTYGVSAGANISGLDTDNIRARVAMESDEIAWIAINIRGTVAQVQIREEEKPPTVAETEGDGVNLVASRDALILGYELVAGEAVAQVGSTVKEGELLVSGLVESKRFGWRALKANGRVWAQTQRHFSVSIPYEYTVSVPVEREILEVSLIFFSKEQKLFKNSGNHSENCDKIKLVRYVYSSPEHTIPLGFSTVSRMITEESVQTHSAAQARELAYFELNRLIAAEGEGVRIVRKEISETEGEKAFTLECTLVCTEDIAMPAAFFLQGD